ncbi:sigma-70 family RNA polymerase sigma factor [Candidatus Aminicenantes bacterium AC-708-M15]|jgi:RNA polymerase sigma-70 factor (ECF subfamily)|nr:sigma-70 family RNA polymerase sigma factor [SCandidatus Aminicenantes bacterium Aminicenantia_JdfR_composite]MCP2596747.1 sigma-70 family RNA polymerase sigma factor [Candidatus Aminicenantes bacterium AC-335-G13]MCP2604413.1 sigma-70 family RNA polymerase sigma factor [Candidatus Aminicenantes bacterium AC-708-M15]MCP2619259.1 sigma-70 family RNA polymerase sigma factor [Candidatus Aminicenantes bacterium AC-335-K20]MCP2620439.1 sigma-70 family RNA polymerase sigma factor [Candidatus Amini
MKELSEDELIQKAKKGEVEAFGQLVKKYQRRIYNLIYQMTFNHEDADDLSQETFLKAYKSLGDFKRESSFYTWIYRIAVNLVINHIKKRKREKMDLNFEIQYNNSPQRILENKEFNIKLKETISMLPASQRVTLNLVINHGLSHKEVAKIQGCSEGTVSWRIFRARKFLKEKLKPYLKGELK